MFSNSISFQSKVFLWKYWNYFYGLNDTIHTFVYCFESVLNIQIQNISLIELTLIWKKKISHILWNTCTIFAFSELNRGIWEPNSPWNFQVSRTNLSKVIVLTDGQTDGRPHEQNWIWPRIRHQGVEPYRLRLFLARNWKITEGALKNGRTVIAKQTHPSSILHFL